MVKAVRAAISLENNSEEELKHCVCHLYDEVVRKNNLLVGDLISIIFSQTKDICHNPAKALRTGRLLSETPLFCTQEPECLDFQQERILRMLVYFNTETSLKPRGVYLGRARELRGDIMK